MNQYLYTDELQADRKAIALRRDGEQAWVERCGSAYILFTSARLFGDEAFRLITRENSAYVR